MKPSSAALVVCVLLCGEATAFAAQPTRIASSGHWEIYSYKSDKGQSCYALARPAKMMPSGIDHGDNYFIVSPGGKGNSPFVPEALMGYQLKPGSDVKVIINSDQFQMFTKDNTAWVRREDREPVMVSAMKGGSTMTVEAISARGTSTNYTYSLSGFTAALQQIKACHQ